MIAYLLHLCRRADDAICHAMLGTDVLDRVIREHRTRADPPASAQP